MHGGKQLGHTSLTKDFRSEVEKNSANPET